MKLRAVSLEYENGTTRRLNAGELDLNTHAALAVAGLCDPPKEIAVVKHYLVLEWRDGWKEVLAIDNDAVDLIRYYVIRRIEDSGRIALDIGRDYPRLIIINRIPKDLERLVLVGPREVKAYSLDTEVEAYEGIFEAGGKKEFRKYDRGNPAFKDQFSVSQAGLTTIKSSILEAVRGRGFTPRQLLETDTESRIQQYAEIARTSGLTGFVRQADVYGFIEMVLLGLIAESEE